MFHMDVWMSLVCGSILWGAAWAAGNLAVRAAKSVSAKAVVKK